MKLITVMLVFFAIGCAAPWAGSYKASKPGETYITTGNVTIRQLPTDRLLKYVADFRNQEAISGIPVSGWSDQMREARQIAVLEMLQLDERLGEAKVVGVSDFSDRVEHHLNLNDGGLTDFAKRVGAHYAIWAVIPNGSAQRVLNLPTYAAAPFNNGFEPATSAAYGSPTVVPNDDDWAEYVIYFVQRN